MVDLASARSAGPSSGNARLLASDRSRLHDSLTARYCPLTDYSLLTHCSLVPADSLLSPGAGSCGTMAGRGGSSLLYTHCCPLSAVWPLLPLCTGAGASGATVCSLLEQSTHCGLLCGCGCACCWYDGVLTVGAVYWRGH